MEPTFYLNEIYQFQRDGKNLVLEVPTSRVFSVDKHAYEIISFANGKTREEIVTHCKSEYNDQSIDEILEELKKARLIFDQKVETVTDNPIKYTEYEIRNMDLIISQDCNMRCIYCFADQGAFRGKRSFMSSEVGRKAIDFLMEKSGKTNKIGVVFFGGEPLLNIPLIKELTEYGNNKAKECQKTISFSISTNGTIMNEELIEYFNENKIHVQVSIDGDSESQNVNRPFKNRKDSYARVEKNSLELIRKTTQKSISARTTATSNTAREIFRNVLHLLSLGFKEVHVETAEGTEGYGFLDKEHYELLKEEIGKIAVEMKSKISSNIYFGFNNLIRELRAVNMNSRKTYSCGAGRGYIAISPDGGIYPCHRFVGNNKYSMGNIMTDTFDRFWEEEIHDTTNVFTREPCKFCWARFFCGGDCIAVSESYCQNLTAPNPNRCDLIKHIVSLAIMIFSSIPKESKKEIEKTYNLSITKKKGVREEV